MQVKPAKLSLHCHLRLSGYCNSSVDLLKKYRKFFYTVGIPVYNILLSSSQERNEGVMLMRFDYTMHSPLTYEMTMERIQK